MKYSKIFIVTTSLLLLNGCLEVDDKTDNSDVVAALNAQTEAIAQQQQETSQASVTFRGVVVDALDSTPVSSALVTVNVGSETVADGLVVTDGEFEVTELPPNSDIEVIISSENDQFLSRAFFRNTGESSSGAAVNDFGYFPVSQPQEVKISVLKRDDNSSVANLEFKASSHDGTSSSSYKYVHTSTYDAVNGEYSITIPKYIYTNVIANIDSDRDGEIDFNVESNDNTYIDGTDLTIHAANSIDTLTLYVDDIVDEVLTDVEYRISIIDSETKPIVSAELMVEDTNNEMVKSVYDAVTEQHVITAKFSQQITIRMPAFTDNDIYYQSASIRLYKQDEDNLSVSISGAQGTCCYEIPNAETITLAISPYITTNSSDLEVVTKSENVDSVDSSFSVFYSQAVAVPSESVSLESTSGFSVVKGNDDDNDFILPGVTLFSGGLTIPVSHTMSLNDTKLKVTPESALTIPGNYRYNIGNVEVISTEEVTDIYNDSLYFTLTNTSEVFDINDVKIDNVNFTTNGEVITATNTAGEPSNSSDYSRSVRIFLPASVQSLQNFTMRQVKVVENNTERTDVRRFVFVDNGYISINRYGIVKLAENEEVETDNMEVSIITGAAQADSQFIYRSNGSEYLSDNTATSTNTISYEYAYETLAGEVSTGMITLPVQ